MYEYKEAHHWRQPCVGIVFIPVFRGGSLHLEIISQIGKKLMNMIDSYDDG